MADQQTDFQMPAVADRLECHQELHLEGISQRSVECHDGCDAVSFQFAFA